MYLDVFAMAAIEWFKDPENVKKFEAMKGGEPDAQNVQGIAGHKALDKSA